MSVITLLSDFGADSHYLASFRGALLQSEIDLPFIEITSRVEPFDIVEAAYLSSMVYNDFSKNSIHILATNVVATSFKGHLAAFFNGHFFIAPDNGILTLIFGEQFSNYYRIPTDQYVQKIQKVYLPFISKLVDANFQLDQVAEKTDKIDTKTRINPVKDDKELRGTVLFVDHFGNAYTNVSKAEFDQFVSDGSYSISVGSHTQLGSISNNFTDVQEGDPLGYFSDHGYLVIAIKKSSAKQLLNLRKYKPIIIEKL